MRLVYAFDEEAPGGRELLGGKGIGLAQMTALGVRCPAGFTVRPTRAARTCERATVPEELWAEVDEHVAGSRSAPASASATRPTRCSCRSARAPRSRCRG